METIIESFGTENGYTLPIGTAIKFHHNGTKIRVELTDDGLIIRQIAGPGNERLVLQPIASNSIRIIML